MRSRSDKNGENDTSQVGPASFGTTPQLQGAPEKEAKERPWAPPEKGGQLELEQQREAWRTITDISPVIFAIIVIWRFPEMGVYNIIISSHPLIDGFSMK